MDSKELRLRWDPVKKASFNSIEWILSLCLPLLFSIFSSSFNSIEWILHYMLGVLGHGWIYSLSIPLNGFAGHCPLTPPTSLWIFQFHWMDSWLVPCVRSPSSCTFQFHWMDSQMTRPLRTGLSGFQLSIPLNGFGVNKLHDGISCPPQFLSIPLNGFRGVAELESRIVAETFQFHWMDSRGVGLEKRKGV